MQVIELVMKGIIRYNTQPNRESWRISVAKPYKEYLLQFQYASPMWLLSSSFLDIGYQYHSYFGALELLFLLTLDKKNRKLKFYMKNPSKVRKPNWQILNTFALFDLKVIRKDFNLKPWCFLVSHVESLALPLSACWFYKS